MNKIVELNANEITAVSGGFGNVMGWIKENPYKAAAIGVGIAIVGLYGYSCYTSLYKEAVSFAYWKGSVEQGRLDNYQHLVYCHSTLPAVSVGVVPFLSRFFHIS